MRKCKHRLKYAVTAITAVDFRNTLNFCRRVKCAVSFTEGNRIRSSAYFVLERPLWSGAERKRLSLVGDLYEAVVILVRSGGWAILLSRDEEIYPMI